MLNILTSDQTRQADQYTIAHEPIASIDLMERAAQAFTGRFIEIVPDRSKSILICAGTGNNGGDGLVVARLLAQCGYSEIAVWVVHFGPQKSADFLENRQRLADTEIKTRDILPNQPFPPINSAVIIDALLGTGLNRPIEEHLKRLISHINTAGVIVIAIDIPTGLPAEGPIADDQETIFASDTITFQRPKLSFFFPESAQSLTKFHVVPIGLNESFMDSLPTDFALVERCDILRIYQKRLPFAHKGTYGHALIVAGQQLTMGAALLCTGASIHTGTGLTTTSIPESGLTALNVSYPEAMYLPRIAIGNDLKRYTAIGIGPGLGDKKWLLEKILSVKNIPLVIDADALNTIARYPEFLKKLPKTCILTPHMKEFDRLFGSHLNWWERVETAKRKSVELGVTIVLKNQFTFIVTPMGHVRINPTGNPSLSSGGTGDVLTGMITSFLAQGYSSEHAAILGCYLHGDAGDHLAKQGSSVVSASALIQALPKTIGALTENSGFVF